jgi:hypothetical protein
MTTIIDIADALVTELAAFTLDTAHPVTVVRAYAPQATSGELSAITVTVVPKGTDEALIDRTRAALRHSIDIAVQQKIDTTSNSEADALMALVDGIAEHLRKSRVLSNVSAYWVECVRTAIYSPEHWREQNVFTSVLTVTYQVLQ